MTGGAGSAVRFAFAGAPGQPWHLTPRIIVNRVVAHRFYYDPPRIKQMLLHPTRQNSKEKRARRFEITREMVQEEFEANMMFIMWASSVLSFVTALQWQNFIENSITDIEKKISRPLPSSVSSLIASIILTGVASAVLYGLYMAAKNIVKTENNKGDS